MSDPRFTIKRPYLRALVLTLILAVSAPPVLSYASKQTEEQLEQARQDKKNTENAIEENEEHIEGLESARGQLIGELNNLNDQLTEVSANLEVLEGQIRAKNTEIEETQAELEQAEETQAQQYEAMKMRVKFMYRNGSSSFLEMIGEEDGYAQWLNRKDYIEALSAYDRMMLERFVETREITEEIKQRLIVERAELGKLQEAAQIEQARVSGLITTTSGNIASYTGAIAGAEAHADALQEQLDQQSAQVRALEEKLAEERRLEALSRQSVWRSIGDVTFAEGDRYLLANLIYCEAGGEPYEGQVAVGAVVMNRVLSGAFPDTIVGVIYQRNQFEPALTGRLALALARDDATASCYAAADAAMAGQTNVSDCIFFRTPIPQVTPRYVIGGHIFY